ncbi:unnamed protein product [Gadus morhua 'NCC']
MRSVFHFGKRTATIGMDTCSTHSLSHAIVTRSNSKEINRSETSELTSSSEYLLGRLGSTVLLAALSPPPPPPLPPPTIHLSLATCLVIFSSACSIVSEAVQRLLYSLFQATGMHSYTEEQTEPSQRRQSGKI